MLALSVSAYAAESGEYLKYSESPPATTTSTLSMVAYIFSLLITFAFVIGLAYLASKFLGRKMSSLHRNNDNKILTAVSLGPNKSVCVVEIAGKVFVLGVTDHAINLLQELSSDEEIAKVKAQANIANNEDNYADLFQKQLVSLRQMTSKFPGAFKKNFNYKYNREKR